MFGTHFYHQKVRKCVAIFGALFNNLYVVRKVSSGASISQIKVPLSYAPKEKFLERIRENPDLDNDTKVAIKLPRMSFEISSLADDALQIVEQILPTFNPQYSLTIKPFATEFPTFKEDIPIIIQSVSFADDFEGAMEQRRTIVYTLDFEMKVCFYGAINTGNIIRKSITNVFDMEAGLSDSDIQIQRLTTVPKPTSLIGLADSDFGFTTTVDLTFDSA